MQSTRISNALRCLVIAPVASVRVAVIGRNSMLSRSIVQNCVHAGASVISVTDSENTYYYDCEYNRVRKETINTFLEKKIDVDVIMSSVNDIGITDITRIRNAIPRSLRFATLICPSIINETKEYTATRKLYMHEFSKLHRHCNVWILPTPPLLENRNMTNAFSFCRTYDEVANECVRVSIGNCDSSKV